MNAEAARNISTPRSMEDCDIDELLGELDGGARGGIEDIKRMSAESVIRAEPIRRATRGPEFGSVVDFALSSTGEPSPPIWRISLPRVTKAVTVGQILDAGPVLDEMAARAAYGSGGFSLARLREHLRAAPELQSEKRKSSPDRSRVIQVDLDYLLARGDFDTDWLGPHRLGVIEPFLEVANPVGRP